tara:strand:- start:261 stop:404 length:144 start_codon:yes stop_codon:yes gene_type:complete
MISSLVVLEWRWLINALANQLINIIGKPMYILGGIAKIALFVASLIS